MYREILKHLLIEVKDKEEHKMTPLWLKPILNSIPEFGLDGRRKDFFGLTHRCKTCLFFFGDKRKKWQHEKQCQHRALDLFINTQDTLPWVITNRNTEVTSCVQFKHAIRMCPYPAKAQFLFATTHPNEDNSEKLRASLEDKRDIEAWRLHDGAQQA